MHGFCNKTMQNPPPNVLGANSNIVVFTQPETGNKPILEVINGAQKEVLVEVYLLLDGNIIKVLENARQRGVNVKVMLEEYPFGGGGINNKTKLGSLSQMVFLLSGQVLNFL